MIDKCLELPCIFIMWVVRYGKNKREEKQEERIMWYHLGKYCTKVANIFYRREQGLSGGYFYLDIGNENTTQPFPHFSGLFLVAV